MKKVILAKSAGFCPGVKRAVDLVYEQSADTTKHVCTYGPIIHNDEVVKDLKRRGVTVINSPEELTGENETVIIRSHGVTRKEQEALSAGGTEVLDATCPFVKRIHKTVEEYGRQGREIIITGDPDHPEVKGIRGWCVTPSTVLKNLEDAKAFEGDKNKKYCLVSQTTFNLNIFKELVEILNKKGYDIICVNSICNATEIRQEEARNIARTVDAMIVIGDQSSSNTRKLYEISSKECGNTYYIQTLVNLDLTAFESFRNVGITAGASTPNNIIKEVQTAMSEMSFEQMLNEESVKTIRNGEIVEGKIIDVKEDEIILNIGYKADGIISRNEYSNDNNLDLRTVANVDDTMQAKVLKVNDGEGQVLLSYKKMIADRGNEKLREAFENETVLTAVVDKVLGGGLSVTVDEARVFIPASLVSDTYEKHLEKYEGQEISFVITEFNPRKRRIIGNRKQLLVVEKAQKQKELFERIAVGDIVEGTVKNVTDFGAFIDLGGADGLLHISEMSWGRVDNPKKLFKVGEAIKVLIKDIQGEKIALSLKFADQNPWLTAAEKYAAGNVVEGKVARMTDFGAFVELEPGVDALLHVSQISREHVEKPADVLQAGQIITAKVVDFNGDDRKISLSIKALDAPAKEDEEN